jgi:photosystem II stability/assembly factor-like uncharacterized protein
MKTPSFVVRIGVPALVIALSMLLGGPSVQAQEKPSEAKSAPEGQPSGKNKLKQQPKYPAAKAQEPQPEALDEDNVERATPPKMDKDSAEQILKRDRWFYKQRASADGRIPAGARARALEHMQRRLQAEGRGIRQTDGVLTQVNSLSAAVTNTWQSIGPTPTTGGIFSPVTGRITTIAVDPSDATGSTVLIGGAQGGIWRTTDAGSTWTAVGDQNASLAMGSIVFANSTGTVYAGTGEQASIGFDIYYGAGVLKSTDHGLTWTQTCTTPSPTCPFIGPVSDQSPFGFFTLGGTRISYISVNPGNANMVLVGAQTQFAEGTTEGVYCTDNGGTTWSNVLPDEMSTFVGFASSTVAFAALGNPFGSSAGTPNGNGIYQATAIGANCGTVHFNRLTAATLPAQSTMGRIDIGISPTFATDNTIYASIANAGTASNTNLGVFVTTNGGTTWSQTAAPDVCKQQCWYDNVVKVDPNGGAHAFLGGAAVTSGGAPGWVQRTANGGTSWSSIIPNALGPGLPHVDNHAMAFVKPASGKIRMYLGNDGGIWRTDDAEATPVVWTNLNQSALTLSQFYPALSIHPSTPAIAFGGAQDNGSQNYTGSISWADNQTCGDGTGTAIDTVVPSTVYVACNGLNLAVSTVNGVPNSFSIIGNGINFADNSDFVPPIVADPNIANRVYAGSTKVYQSVDGGLDFTALSGDLVNGTSPNFDALTALAVAPGNSACVYAGADTGQIFVASNVGSGSGNFSPVPGQTSLPPRMIRDIVVDPADPTGRTAYAVFSGFSFVQSGVNDPKGHVFKTADLGATWTDISCTVADCSTPAGSDLPNIPVHSLVIDPDLSGTLYVGTDIGVYQGTCGGAPSTCTWSVLSTGLPRVAVLSLRLHRASRTLRAATHGRGMWDLVLNNFTFTGPHISSFSPVSSTVTATPVSLTIVGSGLSTATGVQWTVGTTTTVLPPQLVADTQVDALVPSALLTGGAVAQVSVATGAGPSNSLPFVVLGNAPTIASVSPTSVPLSSLPTTITVTGAGFTSSSKILLNPDLGGTPLVTTFTDSSHLTATVPAASFGSTNSVGVTTPPPGGGTTVTTQTVTLPTLVISAPAPANNNFANAINITSTSFSDTRDSSAATVETNDPTPACSQNSQIPFTTGRSNTIWYKVLPSGTGVANMDTVGSSYDSVVSVWTGSGTTETSLTATAVACNDDVSPGITTSQITNLTLTAGTTYFIMVSSFGQADPNSVAFGGKSILNFSFSGTIGATTGGSFTIVVQGTPATITATAGTTTNVPIPVTVHPTGATPPGNVSITCAGLPPGVTCDPLTINATSTSADATGNLNVKLVGPSTTLTAMALPHSDSLGSSSARFGLITAGVGSGFAALLLLLVPGPKRLRAALGLGLVSVLSLVLGCGGGGGGGGGGVVPVATTTQITLTPPAKQPTTAANFVFSVAVSGGSTPTGSVQFLDAGTNLGSAVTLASGSAMFTVNGLTPVGTHPISTHYNGDAGHLASSSGAINVTVTGTTTVTISAQGATNGNQTLNVTIN